MSDTPEGARKGKSTNWGLMALMTGAVSAWLIYDIASASETPRQAVALLEYFLLACGLIGFAGAVVKLLAGE
jgi:hypothetical protein